MGKSKKRILAKAKHEKLPLELTRVQAVTLVCEQLTIDSTSKEAKNIISLFGIKAEELSEAGLSYEVLRSLDGLIE